jgi:hypothetical protein
MHRQKTIVLPTLVTAVFTGLTIWLVAGPPPHSPRPINAHQFVVSIK